MNFLKRIEKKLRWKRIEIKKISGLIQALYDLTLFHQTKNLQSKCTNPLNAFGRKCFSQTDEDGITLEILRRLDLMSDGIYAEFGVGDGMENNTLVLAALGWKGFWVGGENLKPRIQETPEKRFAYLQKWITLENIVELARSGLHQIGAKGPDVISLDLDGNDIYLVESLLSAQIRPKLFIVEYNAKFPPPIEFRISYDANHSWQNDDYFGASLASFEKLFNEHNYQLVCCNSHTGSNAFFVDRRYSPEFSDIPNNSNEIYAEPRYWLYRQYGHPVSLKTVERILNADDA